MSGFCGWIDFSASSRSRVGAIAQMGRALDNVRKGAYRTEQNENYAIGVAEDANYCWLARADDGVVAVCGAVHLSEVDLLQAGRAQGLATALVRGFKRYGPNLLKHLHGHYSLLILLEQEREALLAIDRVGVQPLAYTRIPGGLAFGTTADAIGAHPDVTPQVNRQAIYDYLYYHVVPGSQSAFVDYTRLLPGTYVHLSGDVIDSGQYWEVVYEREHDRLSIADLKEEFRELLQKSVHREVGEESCGAFLSGGTDSSTVSALLGLTTGRAARTYSIGFGAAGYDEMEYARISAKHFGTEHHEYYVTPNDVVQAIPRIGQAYDLPFGNSSAVPAYYCARLAAEDGVTRLLAGDGGDELFGGNVRYATQYLFSFYDKLPAPIRAAIASVVYAFPGGERVPPVRKLRHYLDQAAMPLPARLETYNLLERLGVEQVLQKDFLDAVDTSGPLILLQEVYDKARAETWLNRVLAVDLRFTLADNDLPKVTRACALAGVTAGFPLLSEELVRFAARLPVRLKLKGTRLRYFFKEALKDLLPAQVIEKQKHGFGLPFGPWLLSHRPLYELARDALGDLKQRGIVRADFVDTLFDRYVPLHPSYYGTMVWVLMMLEMWFKHHLNPPR